jgi:hypothetical protein
MAILNETIGVAGFEKVSNRIAEILAEEIGNQKDIQGFEEDVQVFIERIQPFQTSEDVSIQVYLKGGTYDGQNVRDVQGEYLYYIDLYTSALQKGNVDASVVSKNKNYRYLGLIRYILSSGKIPTLGFPPGLIGGKYVKSISQDLEFSNFGSDPSKDASFIRFARIVFAVRVQENQALWDGIPLEGNDSTFTYEATDKGTKVVFNN